MNSERELFIEWLKSQPHVLNVGINPDGSFMLKEDQIAWEAWQASTQREGYKLVLESEINEAISAIKRSANIFYDNFSDWIEKEYLDSLADRLDKAMMGAVDE